jgi:hypothetical protein
MNYNYIAEFDLSIWLFNKIVDASTLAEIMGILRGPELKHGASKWFLDLSLVDRIDMDFDKIAGFARFDRGLLDPNVTVQAAALVSTPLAFGVVRMYQALMSDANLDLCIFHQRSECGNFLGVPLHALITANASEQTA